MRIDLSQPLPAIPAGFAALDFPGATNAMGRSVVDLNQGNLRSVNVVEANGRTRVVLNLKQATTYKAEIREKSLLVLLDPVAPVPSASATPPQSTIFAESRNAGILPIKDIDFRRNTDGSEGGRFAAQ